MARIRTPFVRLSGGPARTLWLLLAAALLAALPVRAADRGQAVRLAGLDVTVWGASGAPRPVIVFSHGFHGCATQSKFLMEAFARAGYIVFAPNHADATCNGGTSSWLDKPQAPFKTPEAWTAATYRDRAEDIRRLVKAIGEDPRFRGQADLNRLGLAGHSLGGYTVLGLAGAWPGWTLGGVRAVLALSPYTDPFERNGSLAGLKAPVMYQTGTRDEVIARVLRKPGGSYDQSPPPKYFLEFEDAAHFAWSDMGAVAHDAIAAASVAFMDRYVAGRPASPVLTSPPEGTAGFAFASELGERTEKADMRRGRTLRERMRDRILP